MIDKSAYPRLIWPPADIKIKAGEQHPEIWDEFRRKYIKLTPEEWVRQHLAHFLVQQRGVPHLNLALEYGLKYGKLSKRADLVVFNKEGKLWLLAECKRASVTIDEATALQSSTYFSVLRPQLSVLTNGLDVIVNALDHNSGKFVRLSDIPFYPNLR
ncbi:MAG: type I restriction enzyme HsdR N-terminal domain-containing protein [Salibacteraceae bacterium]